MTSRTYCSRAAGTLTGSWSSSRKAIRPRTTRCTRRFPRPGISRFSSRACCRTDQARQAAWPIMGVMTFPPHDRGSALVALIAIGTTTIVTYLHLRTLAELKPLADRDELTGLYNRRYFKKEAARQIGARRRYRYPLSLLMLDVDHFKRINDEYGHAAGDQVLKALARTLHINAREIDTVCRYGGEEFAVLLPFTNLDSALGKARRVQTAINAVTVHRRRRTITFRVSIGVAEFTSAMRGIKEFVDTADRAMYAAKAAGRNRIMTAARREGRRRRHARRRAKGR